MNNIKKEIDYVYKLMEEYYSEYERESEFTEIEEYRSGYKSAVKLLFLKDAVRNLTSIKSEDDAKLEFDNYVKFRTKELLREEDAFKYSIHQVVCHICSNIGGEFACSQFYERQKELKLLIIEQLFLNRIKKPEDELMLPGSVATALWGIYEEHYNDFRRYIDGLMWRSGIQDPVYIKFLECLKTIPGFKGELT